jgi:opacity protein-like surface antigen
MKKKFLVILLFFSIQHIRAQTSKGDWMVGGDLAFNTAKKNRHILFDPQMGFFFLKNLVLGGHLSFQLQDEGTATISSFGVGPFARYYFGDTKARPFFAGDLSFLSSKIKTESTSISNSAVDYFLGVGASFFINENVAVDGIMGYRSIKYTNESPSGGLNMKVGFQVFLNRRQVRQLKGK